jgi:hypothetical protein
MPTDFAACWNDFTAIAAKKAGAPWLFRGHADKAWELQPNIGRPYKRTPTGSPRHYTSADEFAMFRDFAMEVRRRFDDGPSTDFELLALAQHYGLPTRLLDWTQNLHVAAYFACEDESFDDRDAEILSLGVRTDAIRTDLDALSDEMFALNPADQPIFVRVPGIDFRIHQQHGVFTLHPDTSVVWTPASPHIVDSPFVIPAHLKPEFRRTLMALGFHAGRLMRDFDRVCETIRGRYR